MAAKAIVVLGCGIDERGELGEDAKRSVRKAVEAFDETSADWLVMSGRFSRQAGFRPPVSEAQAMKDFAVTLGRDAQTILTEVESQDTFGNAFFAKTNLLQPLKVSDIIVVAGPNHSAARLEYIFEKVFAGQIRHRFIMHGPLPPAEARREQQALFLLRSLFDDVPSGDDAALYQALRTRHPIYKS